MGLSHAFPTQHFNTGIQVVTKTLSVPFKHLPAAYISVCFLFSFLFEQTPDLSLLLGFWTAWLLMRLFGKTKLAPLQAGDPSPSFALSSYFPERARPTVDYLSSVGFAFANSCKVITAIQSVGISSEPKRDAAKKQDSPKSAQKTTSEQRKKALRILDEEIEKKSGFSRVIEAAKGILSKAPFEQRKPD